jgi:hypothetical protein
LINKRQDDASTLNELIMRFEEAMSKGSNTMEKGNGLTKTP